MAGSTSSNGHTDADTVGMACLNMQFQFPKNTKRVQHAEDLPAAQDFNGYGYGRGCGCGCGNWEDVKFDVGRCQAIGNGGFERRSGGGRMFNWTQLKLN